MTAGAQIDEVHGKTPLRANGQVDPFRRRACSLNVDLVGEDPHERAPGVQVAVRRRDGCFVRDGEGGHHHVRIELRNHEEDAALALLQLREQVQRVIEAPILAGVLFPQIRVESSDDLVEAACVVCSPSFAPARV